jgi:hypothetical protein
MNEPMDARTAGMFNQFALTFAMGLLIATAVAVLLPNDLGLWFFPAGIVVMAVTFVAGGGPSLRPIRPSTPMAMSAKFARVEHDIRMHERNVNWNLMTGGFVIGVALCVAGVAAYFV